MDKIIIKMAEYSNLKNLVYFKNIAQNESFARNKIE